MVKTRGLTGFCMTMSFAYFVSLFFHKVPKLSLQLSSSSSCFVLLFFHKVPKRTASRRRRHIRFVPLFFHKVPKPQRTGKGRPYIFHKKSGEWQKPSPSEAKSPVMYWLYPHPQIFLYFLYCIIRNLCYIEYSKTDDKPKNNRNRR